MRYIFYFHGGGLVSGTPNDLPNTHKKFFEDLGYTIIYVPYPLAPEAKFETILKETLHFVNQYPLNDALFFGRSAGAFLMMHLCEFVKPKALISFYGYMLHDTTWVDTPSQHYNQYPPVHIQMEHLESRFALYIQLRQKGNWRSILKYHHLSKPNQNIPIFIWHSLFDPDVPYKEAKFMQSYFNNSTLKTALVHEHEIDIDHFNTIKQDLKTFIQKVTDT